MFVICCGTYSDMEIKAVTENENEAIKYCAFKNSDVDRLGYIDRYHYREVPLVSDICGGKINAKPYYLYSVEVRTNNHYKDIYFRDPEMCIMSSEKSNRVDYHSNAGGESEIDTSTDEIRIRSNKYNSHEFVIDNIKLSENNEDLALKIAEDKFNQFLYDMLVENGCDIIEKDQIWYY